MTRPMLPLLLLCVALSACAGLLGHAPSPAHPFEHRAHVTKGINCLRCHTGIMADADGASLHLPSRNGCTACHERPHDARDCANCHGEAYVRAGADMAKRHLRFDHRSHMPAAKGECVRCHADVGLFRPESLRPKMASCFGCHAHENQWAVRDCDGCHIDLPGEKVLPSSHLLHDGDWLREHGVRAASARDLCATCHSERSCAGCHGVNVPALPARLSFDDVKQSGLHRAGFRSRHAGEARANPGLCTTCHSESSCGGCHDASGAAGSNATSPHRAGWITTGRGGGEHGSQARLDPGSCASCHGGAGEQLCVGCHRVGGPGGNPHGLGFASTKDKTRDLPCRLCHGAP